VRLAARRASPGGDQETGALERRWHLAVSDAFWSPSQAEMLSWPRIM